MTWSPTRFLLSCGIVPLVALACAHSHGAAPTAQAPPPPPPTTGQHATSIEQLLAGKVSGATVQSAPGGGLQIRLAGATSFRLTQQPLYIVDGNAIEPGPNGTLTWLNARDIESISVLKYGPDTAIYGVRGANGVIVIKTKGTPQ